MAVAGPRAVTVMLGLQGQPAPAFTRPLRGHLDISYHHRPKTVVASDPGRAEPRRPQSSSPGQGPRLPQAIFSLQLPLVLLAPQSLKEQAPDTGLLCGPRLLPLFPFQVKP